MKCLVISHNPFSTFQNMGKTFLSLFSEFQSDELCQFYIYPNVPDVEKCHSYYRVTDKDVLKGYYRFSAPGGEVVPCTERHDLYEDPTDEARYRSPKNKTTSRMLARDLMWKFSRWNNKKLKAWLDRENPTCIFVAPGPYRFIYDIALRIAKKRNLPLVAYLCDDYYFVKKPSSILERYRVKKLQKKIRQLMQSASHVVTICDEMSEAYQKCFGLPTTTVMTGTNYEIASAPTPIDTPRTITYMGNIRCDRYLSLAEIGKTLDTLNGAQKTDYALHIYTAEKDAGILAHFQNIRSVKLCGFVSGEEFLKVFRQAHLLLHTEAFNEKSIDLVKHSVSTKIADTLASGIPLLAYGPDAVSSMKHLLRHNCALCATSPAELPKTLHMAFSDAEARHAAAKRGLDVAKLYHDPQKTGKLFYESIRSLHENTAN